MAKFRALTRTEPSFADPSEDVLLVPGFIGSVAKIEILDERGNVELSLPWRPNLITDRFLNQFANKTFANVDDLRNFLVIGASNNPKEEIKRSSGNITATTSTQGQDIIFTTSADFFDSNIDWTDGWEIVIPSTGRYARILQRNSNTKVRIDRDLNLSSATSFEVWKVNADLPATDRVAVSDTSYGPAPQTAATYDNNLSAFTWQREIARTYTVTGSNPISFSSFAFSPTGTYQSGDPTNATIYELVRAQNGSPTTLTINPGKRIRVRHRLVAIAFASNNIAVNVREYNLADQEVNNYNITANNTLATPNNSATQIQEMFEKLLSPASNFNDGQSGISIELVPLNNSNQEMNSFRKTFTQASLENYTNNSFSRAKEFLLEEEDFVTTFYGVRLIFKRSGNTQFTLTTSFTNNSSFQKDNLHELRIRVNVSWYRYYSA